MNKLETNLNIFSNELIVELVFQLLENNSVTRSVISTGINNWSKICEVLICSIKNDLRVFKTAIPNSSKPVLFDRKSAISVICNWNSDIQKLSQSFPLKVSDIDSRIKTDLEANYTIIKNLAELSNIIAKRNKKSHDDTCCKREIVFIQGNEDSD